MRIFYSCVIGKVWNEFRASTFRALIGEPTFGCVIETTVIQKKIVTALFMRSCSSNLLDRRLNSINIFMTVNLNESPNNLFCSVHLT